MIQSEFRTLADLFDRIDGGAAPGGVKAVAPSGAELITMELPDDVDEQVSILGESCRSNGRMATTTSSRRAGRLRRSAT